jgi:hypothetical protein
VFAAWLAVYAGRVAPAYVLARWKDYPPLVQECFSTTPPCTHLQTHYRVFGYRIIMAMLRKKYDNPAGLRVENGKLYFRKEKASAT